MILKIIDQIKFVDTRFKFVKKSLEKWNDY